VLLFLFYKNLNKRREKMDAMEQAIHSYFKKKGFDVATRPYDCDERSIEVEIGKHDRYTHGVFNPSRILIFEFCRNLLEKFERDHEPVKPSHYYMGKPYYINKKGEEKKMTHYEEFHKAAENDKDVKKFMNLIMNSHYGASKPVAIEKVVFNDPATIILWTDGTKTVVKCDNENYDPEKGMAMAIAKKVLGNKSNYFNEFRKWLPKEEEITPHSSEEWIRTPLSVAMHETGISFTELSERTGIPAGRLIKYHRGQIKPKKATIEKIESALGGAQINFDI
jgi:hypothetical protein